MWYTPRYVQQPFPGDNNFSFVVRKDPVCDSRAKPKQKLDAKKKTNNGGSKVVQKKQPKEKKSPIRKVDKTKKSRKKKDRESKRSIDENNFI